MDKVTQELVETLNPGTHQVALATGMDRAQCPWCESWGPWEIPANLIGVVCGNCGAWCLVRIK